VGEVSFDIIGVDKASQAFQKVGNSVDETGDKLDRLSKIPEPKAPTALTKGLKEIQAATDKLAVAQRFEADQLGKVRVAEAKLSELREIGVATDAQLIAAEERLASAYRGVEAAQRDAARASSALDKARSGASEPAKQKVDFDLSGGLAKLKSGLLSEAKSAGILAGATLAGGLAAGLSTVGAAGFFIAIAAAAASSNEQVAASYSRLWAQVKTGVKGASDELSGEFIHTAESLGATFSKLQPQIVQAMAAARPAVTDLTDGIDRLATQAMPGLVTAAKASSLASGGLADAMESAGRGVSNFFTESSKGAQAGGESFAAFGRIVERLGSFAGRIIADLANNAVSVFPALENVVDAAAGAIENLAHSALPALASGAALSLTGLGLLLNLANTLITALGPLAPQVSNVATSLKLLDLVSFGQVGASFDRFKASIGQAEGFAAKVKTGFSSLVTSGLGPLVLVAGAAAFGLDALSASQQRVAERQRALTSAFRESKGAIDDNVRATVAQQLAQDGLLQKGKDLGLSASTLTDAWLGNKDAVAQLNAATDRYQAALEGQGQLEGQVAEGSGTLAQKAYDLAHAFGDQSGEVSKAANEGRLYAEAVGKAGAAAAQAKQPTDELAKALKAVRDTSDTAGDKVTALMRVMDELAGRKPDIEEVTKAWEELIDSFAKDAFDAADKGTRKWAQSLVDARGNINLTTEDGRKLFDIVRGAEKDFAQTALAMSATGASSEEVRAKLLTMRDAFIATAEKMGFTRSQAEQLANKYGLIPKTVDTAVNSNLAPEIVKAISLGNEVRALPDGHFAITANTDAARNQITSFIQDQNGRVITIRVNTVSGAQTNTAVTAGGSVYRARLKAAGGWIKGPGTSTSDSIPTWLSNDEFVVKADAARRNAALLEAINAGRSVQAGSRGSDERVLTYAGAPTAGRSWAANAVAAGGSTTVIKNYYLSTTTEKSTATVRNEFARMEMLAGP
jgi:hypothetical protein